MKTEKEEKIIDLMKRITITIVLIWIITLLM